MKATVGQTASGESTEDGYTLLSGFWYQEITPPTFVQLTIPHVTACTTGVIRLPVIVSDFDTVAGMQLRILFDPLVVEPTGDTVISAYLSNLTLGGAENRINVIWENFAHPLTLQDGDTLLTFLFNPVGSFNDESAITWDNEYSGLFDPIGDPIPLSTQDGSVGLTCLCNCGGAYPSFGDITCDGAVNPVDVVYMVNYVYKNIDNRCDDGWVCPYEPGDVNCDHAVNPVDVVRYVNYVYKNITPFPCDPCSP